MKSSRLRFGRHELHLDRGSLLLDGNEVVIRPKTFKVLQYLVENPGRLVSKEELFAAVWPNLVVTDDTLVQSIGELRRALGEDGTSLIKTIPRRGYRLDSVVSAITAVSSTSAEAMPSFVAPSQHPSPQIPAGTAQTSEEPLPDMHPGRRTGLFALPSAVALLVLALLWGGLATDWTFSPNGSGPAKSRDPGVRIAIAVLPFVNMSEHSGREYFSDGLTQDVINALGRFSDLTVMSWNAVYPYKGQPASPSEVTRRLAVHYQVEGSVIREDERVRVVAQLVSQDGRVLWSARFDEPLTDLFVLRDRIATEVAGALAIRVTRIEQKRILQEPTETLEAYDYILRARHSLQRPTRANNIEARALLRRAIHADPGFAAAHAELAENYHVAASMGWTESPTEALSMAEELAIKALSLDEAQVRAHLVLGRIHIYYQRYEQARVELDRALAVNPSDARALAGRGNVLMWLGDTDAAIEVLERAQRLDPELNPIDRFALSLAYYLKHRYESAIEQAERNLRDTTSAGFNRVVLAAAFAQQNRASEALGIAAAIRRTDPALDPAAFGGKFRNSGDLEHLRDGMRKAGLFTDPAPRPHIN